MAMELGISGRKAIVCASSRGLGKGCAMALAQAGVSLVINGRDRTRLEQTADDIRRATGVAVTPVVADIARHEGQQAVLAACPDPDILVNNNGGPPHRDFRELDRAAILDGLTMNMVCAIEMTQKVIDGMAGRGFGRIVNITSISVRMPVAGLDLSSGARAGLTAFLGGVARSVADRNVTINHLLPGYFDTDRMRGGFATEARRQGSSEDAIAAQRGAMIPAKRFGNPDEFGQTCAFLCSQHAAYITGQSILMDGGLYRSTF
jgi:3-oxoacyl-[acyl-carrier protein] reductase